MPPLPILDHAAVAQRLREGRRPFHAAYYAMYSSLWQGIVTAPELMLLPLDDHLVHRGDGIFETFKCVAGRLYNLPAHLDRCMAGAARIGLPLAMDRNALTEAVAQTVRAGGRRDCLVRLFLARGPGGMGVSPYECPQPAAYVIAYELKPSFMVQHPGGARVRSSTVPVKPPPFANIKSVNYLYNVLMKKEAVDAGVDFVVSFDEAGHLAEGATENAGLVTADGALLVPRPDRILPGTTMQRALELAEQLVTDGRLARTGTADLARADLARAAEILIFGTTPDVTAVVEFDGRAVGDGRPGPVARALGALLEQDIRSNPERQTVVFP